MDVKPPRQLRFSPFRLDPVKDYAVVTVPASVWQGGSVSRALTTGGCVGIFFGALALLDSGNPLAAAIVFVILGTGYGIWMARRMARYWPGARELTGAERVMVVRAARRGELVDDSRLARSVIDYSRGLHAVAETARRYRWLLWFMLAVAAVLALWDTVFGSTRDAVASSVYVTLLAIELFWWPKRQAQLLSNADRAADAARRIQGPA